MTPDDPYDEDGDDDNDEGEEEEEEEFEDDEEVELTFVPPPPPRCPHCGGCHENCPTRTRVAPSLVSSTDRTNRKESTIVRTKDLDNFKVSTFPNNAAEFRGWRNALIAKIAKYDCSRDSYLTSWVSKAFDLRGKEAQTLKEDSESCPRLDKIIASELVEPKHLTSSNEIGLDFQAYIEECTMEHRPARGRHMINMLAQNFDLDKHRGALLTQLQVLQIPLEGHSVQQLTTFRQKVTYALNAVPKEDRPDDRLLGEWLFQRLKAVKKLEYEIREIKNSSPKSSKRLFPWLWRKLRDILVEAK